MVDRVQDAAPAQTIDMQGTNFWSGAAANVSIAPSLPHVLAEAKSETEEPDDQHLKKANRGIRQGV